MSIPLWLFSGPEIGERNAAVDALKKNAEKQYGSLDIHLLYASDTSLPTVIDILQNGSLFADARFVIVRNAETIKLKEDIALLTQWVKESANAQGVFLVLISDEISIDKKVEALVPKDQKKIFWELFENKKQEWIRRFFSQHSIRIEPEAVNILLELIENNTDALKTACSHLSLFFEPGSSIDAEAVSRLMAHDKEETAFTLFEALTHGNFEYALSIYRKLSLSKESSPIQIIAGLTYCFRRLRDWHGAAKNGETDEFSLKKIGFTSKKAIDQYRRAAVHWNADQTEAAIALLAQTDTVLRSGGQEVKHTIMEHCLYRLAFQYGTAAENCRFESFQ